MCVWVWVCSIRTHHHLHIALLPDQPSPAHLLHDTSIALHLCTALNALSLNVLYLKSLHFPTGTAALDHQIPSTAPILYCTTPSAHHSTALCFLCYPPQPLHPQSTLHFPLPHRTSTPCLCQVRQNPALEYPRTTNTQKQTGRTPTPQNTISLEALYSFRDPYKSSAHASLLTSLQLGFLFPLPTRQCLTDPYQSSAACASLLTSLQLGFLFPSRTLVTLVPSSVSFSALQRTCEFRSVLQRFLKSWLAQTS